MSSFVGLSLLATHGRPSIMITLSGPSCATTHVPTIGSNDTGGLPTVSLLKSTLTSAARTTLVTVAAARTANPHFLNIVFPFPLSLLPFYRAPLAATAAATTRTGHKT